jgi:anti-sigma factor RsiW
LEFEAEELKPLGIVFNAYLERHLAAARYRLKDDLVAQAAQIAQLDRKQKQLMAQANAIAKAQVDFEAKAKAERERAKRLNNEKFTRYIDNLEWWIRVVVCSGRNLAWAVGLTALILVPSTAALTIRTVVDESCFKSVACAWALKTFIR